MGALGHIFVSVSIYYCVMNILSTYYSDVIIKGETIWHLPPGASTPDHKLQTTLYFIVIHTTA